MFDKTNLISFFLSDNKISAYSSSECVFEYTINSEINQKLEIFFNNKKNHSCNLILHSDNALTDMVTYPDYGALNVLKKIQLNTESNNSKTSIAGSLLLQKPSMSDEKWKYLHSTIKLSKIHQSILQFILLASYQVTGIHFLSFEIIKTVKAFYKELSENNKKMTNVFFVRSKNNFATKITFKNSSFIEATHYHITRTQTNAKIFESEKILSSLLKQNNECNYFFFSPPKQIQNSNKLSNKLFIRVTEANIDKISESSDIFENHAQKAMKAIKSQPLKVNKLKKLNFLKKYKRLQLIPALILVSALIFLGVNFYFGKRNLESQKNALLKKLQEVSFYNQELHKHHKKLSKHSNQNLLELSQSPLKEITALEISEVINRTNHSDVKIFSIDVSSNDNQQVEMLVGFMTEDNKTPHAHIKKYISNLNKELPNKKITYSRGKKSNIYCESFCFMLQIIIKGIKG